MASVTFDRINRHFSQILLARLLVIAPNLVSAGDVLPTVLIDKKTTTSSEAEK